MSQGSDKTNPNPLSDRELADLLEREGPRIVKLLVETLRDAPALTVGDDDRSDPHRPANGKMAMSGRPPSEGTRRPSRREGPPTAGSNNWARHWTELPAIEGHQHSWPEVHEHYGPIHVYETHEGNAVFRIGIGVPKERMKLYGTERGWLSVWSIINGSPRDLLASFTDADDFETSGERVAIIRGRGGAPKAGFAPDELHLLPELYPPEKVAIHRDRCNGPQAKNRLAVVATDEDVELMLEHGLRQWRLKK